MTELGYLLKQDITTLIDSQTLSELTGGKKAIGTTPAIAGDDSLWQKAYPFAIEESKGYLSHWFDTDAEFAPFYAYTGTDSFSVGDRVAGDEISGLRAVYVCIQNAPAGTALTDTDYFEERDTRNKAVLQAVVYITIYTLSRRNAPRQVADQRRLDYEDSIKTLQAIQRAEKNHIIASRTDVPSDDAGQSVAWGAFDNDYNDIY